jgi:hypothetical protein
MSVRRQSKTLRRSLERLRVIDVFQFGQSEIEQLHATRRQHDVAGLQIAMNHAFPMRGVERGRDLASGHQRPIDGKRATLQPVGECLSFEELHDQERHAPEIADVMNRADVRVGDSGHGPGFALESFELHSCGAGCRQDLDRDRPVELWIPGGIDFTHTSGAERREDPVTADSFSDSQGHGG